MNQEQPFSSLFAKTIIDVNISPSKDAITFKCSDGTEYFMKHRQDCCESVSIEDVCGEWSDILNQPILQAEESTSGENPANVKKEFQYSFTWTFYRLTTRLGQVVIRWYGESNGYYSESVSFYQTK